MDDAGGGRRGLRAVVTEGLSRSVATHYGLDISGAADLGGSANLNLLVDRNWVVRIYRPYVGSERLALIQSARRAIAIAGIPVAETLLNLQGQPFTAVAGRYVEVERFVRSDGRANSWDSLERALPLLGRMHHALSRIADRPSLSTDFANHISASQVRLWTTRANARIGSWGPTQEETDLAQGMEELATRIWEAERPYQAGMPNQAVHGDFWDNNVLYAADEVVLVGDFDFMGFRPRIDDLALTLYFANSEFPGERVSTERSERLRRLVDAYDSGLSKRLSFDERSALPLAIARQPLWAAGKWLALLDSEETARRLAQNMTFDVRWALNLVRDPRPWQDAFT